jgi:DNA invertase Pin-like site-specific DNA recombinase
MKPDVQRAVIYARVSQETATNVVGSMTDQVEACRAMAASLPNVTLIPDGIYEEVGRSAYTEDPSKRPAFMRLLADARSRKFDLVLLYKFDRFSRKTRLGLQCRADLETVGVTILSATEKFDDSAGGRFAARTMLSIAELYSDQLAERIRTRRQAEAASGRHLGHAPVGYRSIGKGAIEPHPPYDQMVHVLMELVATGQCSSLQIVTALTDQGYTMPSGRPLASNTVRHISYNAPLYAGQVLSGGVWIPGQHAPIISNDLCARVLDALSRRSHPQRRYVRSQGALLAGLLYCERCRQSGRDSKLYYHSDGRRQNPWVAYRCAETVRTNTCRMSYARADRLEAQVFALTDAFALPKEWFEEALTLLEQPAPDAPTIDRAKIAEKIRRLDNLYQAGAKTDSEWQTERRTLLAQLETTPNRVQPQFSPRDIAAYLADLPSLIRRATIAEQRAILGEVFDQIYADQKTIVAIRPTHLYAPLIQAAHNSLTDNRPVSITHKTDLPLLLPARMEVR